MRNNVVFGIGLVIIGLGLVLVIVPYFTALGSRVWLDETIVVPEGYYYYYYTLEPFLSKTTLHIAFDVMSDGDRSVDFWVMDEANFQKMKANETFEYYIAPSRKSISQMELDWIPPSDKIIYFVWDNTFGFESRSVSAYFSYRFPVSIYTYLGVLLLFAGFATSGYGSNTPSPSSSRKLIIAGYIFATLGGLIGFLLGMELNRRDSSEDKLHGKIILVIGVFAIISYILLLLL